MKDRRHTSSDADFSLQNSGEWTVLENGDRKRKQIATAVYFVDNFEKAENHHLARVNLHYATENFVDEHDRRTQQFIKNYKKINYIKCNNNGKGMKSK